MGRKSQTKFQLSILALALLLFVSLTYAASFTSTVTNPPTTAGIVQAGAANQLFNFSVSNLGNWTPAGESQSLWQYKSQIIINGSTAEQANYQIPINLTTALYNNTGLVGSWHFTNNDTSDSSGYGNNGNQSGGVNCTATGKVGGGCEFDGSDDYINMGTGASLNPTNLTLEAWIKTSYNYVGLESAILGKYGGTYGTAQYLLSISTSNKARVSLSNGVSEMVSDNAPSITSVNDGNWHHITVTYNGSATNMYVDGLLEHTTPTTGTIATTSTSFYIGKVVNSGVGYFNGSIDEVRIYNRSLSAQEISDMYNATKSRLDYQDLRFTYLNQSSGAEQNISYWLESDNQAWVKVPNVTASTVANTTLYMYYGNPGATYNNSLGGNSTFLFFDDFNSGSTPDTNKWTDIGGTNTLTNGYLKQVVSVDKWRDGLQSKTSFSDFIFEGKMRESSASNQNPAIMFRGNGVDWDTSYLFRDCGGGGGTGSFCFSRKTSATIYQDGGSGGSITSGVWYNLKVIANGTRLRLYVTDMNTPIIDKTNDSISSGYIGTSDFVGFETNYDDFRVRSYASPEPNVLSITPVTGSISQVKITLPSGFGFLNGTNGTSAASTGFSNTSTILSWSNTTSSGFISNGTTQYFWFNASVPSTPANYSFNVTTLDTAGVLNWTIVNVSVKSITLTETLNATVVNPSDSVKVSGQATLQPDGTNVANNSMNVFLDGQPVNVTNPGNWTPSGESQAKWQYRKPITINGSTAEQANFQVPINLTTALYNNTGLVGSWHFTNNDTSDSSGYGNNGVQNGGVNCTVAGKVGGGCGFDGNDDSITVADNAALDFISTSKFTIALWTKLNSNKVGGLIAKRGATPADTTFQYYIGDTGGNIRFYDGIAERASTTTISAGVWTQLVFNHMGDGSVVIYKNGVYDSTISYGISKPANNDPLVMGVDGTGGGNYFNGTIDEVRIYNRSLSAQEISDMYNATKSRLDYQDLRFTYLNQSSGAEQNISYWLESDNQAWVKVPNVTAFNVSNTTLYMYYGNPTATYNNSLGGNNTFNFFDDFNTGTSPDSAKWTLVGGSATVVNGILNHTLASESRLQSNINFAPMSVLEMMQNATTTSWQTLGFGNTGNTLFIRLYSDTNTLQLKDADVTEPPTNFARNIYTKKKIIWDNITNVARFYENNVEMQNSPVTGANYIPDVALPVRFFGSSASHYVDWIFVRSYASPEPSVLSVGSEQSPTQTNSTGGYNYTFTAPATAGTHTVKVNLTDANGIYGENTTTFDVRTLVFDQFNLSDADGQLNGILNPSEAYNLTVRIQETNSTVNYTISSGTFNVTVSGTNYSLYYTGSGGVWKTNTTAFTASSSLGNYSFLANFTGTSGNGINYVTQTNNNYTYYVKQLNITYAISDTAIYATESSLINGTVYREPEHAASAGTPVQASVNSGSLTSGWWNSAWPYRRAITINGSTSAQANYQVNVIINSSNVGGNFNWSTYGNDTRFTWLNTTSNSEQNISFWIEYWNNATAGNNASIWVKVPNVTASNVANTTLYMYYGNPSATYNTSLGGNNTFEFFDDFNTNGDLSKWVDQSKSLAIVSNGYLNVTGDAAAGGDDQLLYTATTFNGVTAPIRADFRAYAPLAADHYIGFVITQASNEIRWYLRQTSDRSQMYINSVATGINSVTATNWLNYYIIWESGRTTWGRNGVMDTYSPYAGSANGAAALKLRPYDVASWLFDYIFIHKYASPEPNVLSIGAEQTISAGAYSFTYAPNASVTSITNVNFTLNATDTDGITNTTASPQGVITVYPEINLTISTNNSYYSSGEDITAYFNLAYKDVDPSAVSGTEINYLLYNSSGSLFYNSSWLSTSQRDNSLLIKAGNFTRGGTFYVTAKARNTVVNSAKEFTNNTANFKYGTLNITYQINDTVIYATESAIVNGTIYREPEHAASAGTPVQASVNSGNLTATVTWWNNSWLYRKTITLNGSTSAQANYQVNVIINSSNVGGNFNWSTYGNDTRFTWLNTTSNSEQNISFWIEYWNNATAGNNASIWVKVPDVTASTVANTILYMYYGNPTATSASNVNTTFIREISSVIGAWDLNGDALDRSGNAHNGILYGNTGYAAGIFGQGANFQGTTNDYIDIPEGSYLNFGANNFTIAGWFKFSSTSGDWMPVSTHNSGANAMSFGFRHTYPTSNDFTWYVASSGAARSSTYTTTLNAGIWYYLVYVRNGTQLKVYVNNGGEEGIYSIGSLSVDDAKSLALGRAGDYNGLYFTGMISRFRIYNRTLSTNEILDIYGNGGNNVGYVTTNYAGKELVRSYTYPEPSMLSVGAEQTNKSTSVSSTTSPTGAYSFTYAPNSSITSITNVNFTLNATDTDGITNTTRSPQGAITVYPQIAVDTWASTTSACANRIADFNNSGALFLCANVTYGSVSGLGGENVTFAVYKNGINNEGTQNPVFNVTNTTTGYFKPAGESSFAWPYRKAIVINGSTSALSDYQTNLTIIWASGMNTTFGDLRFTYYNSTTQAEAAIPHWIESNVSGTNATVWVKANLTTGSNTIYMYYGNPSATYNNSLGGNNTFVFFDDFKDGLNKWTVTGGSVENEQLMFDSGNWNIGSKTKSTFSRPLIIEWKDNSTSTDMALQTGYLSGTFTVWYNVDGGAWHKDEDGDFLQGYIGSTPYGTSTSQQANAVHKYRLDVLPASGYTWYYDDTQKATTAAGTQDNYYVQYSMGWPAGAKNYIDDVRVRKYASPEPSVLSTGSQETPSVIAYASFTPNESSQYSLNVTAWNANINPSVTATDSHTFEFGQLNISSVNYDTVIYTTETTVVSGLIRDFMNSSWLNNATTANISISATSGTFNANWTLVNSTGGFNFTYTPPALSSTGSATITINASYGNITGGWSGTISITPAIAVDTWATNASCASRPSAIAEVPTVLNDTGLVGYWKFNSVNASNYTADSSGMNNNGQVLGGAALTPSGKFGAGMQFDGGDDYVQATSAFGNVNFKNTDFSLELWLNRAVTAERQLFYIGAATGTNYGFILGVDNTATPVWALWHQSDAGQTGRAAILGSTTINVGNWYHVVVTHTAGEPSTSNTQIYVNGVGLATSGPVGYGHGPYGTSNIIRIGDDFNGFIDEVKIYNRSLLAEEISALYNRTALSLCANVTYGQNKMAGAYVNFTVDRTGYSVYGANPANTITNLYDTGTIVSTEITPDESTKYTLTAKAWNPDVSSAVASDTYGYTYGKVNTTIALSDNIIYDSETSQVSGKVYDWLNEGWTRNATTWWNSSWPYRKAITINGSTSVLTDYQANLTIIWASGMNNTFQDLRFTYYNSTTQAETQIPYWIEQNYTSQNATAWIKTNLTTGSNTIYMYYGNPSAASASNGANTFTVFNFDGFTEVDPSSQITVTSAKVDVASQTTEASNVYKTIDSTGDFSTNFELYVTTMSGDSASDVFLLGDATSNIAWSSWGSNNGIGVNVQSSSGTKGMYIYNYSSGTGTISSPILYSAGTPYYITFSRSGTTATLSVFSDAARTTHIAGSPVTLAVASTAWTKLNIANNMLTYSGTRAYYIQNLFVRSYASPEPSMLSVGAEETPGGATVSLSATGGTITSSLATNSTGGYNTTYTPPSITSIQTYTLTANATDADTINSSTVSTQITVYPAIGVNVTTNQSWYNIGQTINATATVFYGSSLDNAEAKVMFEVIKDGYRYPSNVTVNTSSWITTGSNGQASYLYTFNESGKYYVKVTANNSVVNSAVIATAVKNYTAGRINTTINLNDTAIYTNENALVSGKVYDWMNEGWARNTTMWWNASWQYRKPITINGSTAEQANYQVLINLTSSNFDFSKANSQGNDTRFTWLNTTSGLEQNVSFWIENWTSSGSLGNATLWVKVPNVTASNVANTTLYMYYGNPSATYNNSLGGNSTFLFFDDFSDGDKSQYTTFNGAWTESNGILQQTDTSTAAKKIYKNIGITDYVIEAKVRPDTFGSDKRMGPEARINAAGTNREGYTATIAPGDVTKFEIFDDEVAQGTQVSPGFTFTTGIWYNLELAVFGNSQYANAWVSGTNRPSGYQTSQAFTTHQTETNIGFYGGYQSAMSFDNLLVRSYASPEPSMLSVGAEETPGGATVSLSATGGTITSSLATNSTGGYNTTYTPPSITSIQTYTLTANATDADTINSSTVSTQIKVYPALSKLNASIYTDRTYYNPGENVTLGTVFRNNETGGLLTGAYLRAKIYRNDTGASAGTLDLPERTGYFVGSYLANFSTSGLTEGWHYINITSEADYNAPLPGSGKLFYVNNFSPVIQIKNISGVEKSAFSHKERALFSVTGAGTPATSGTLALNDSKSVPRYNETRSSGTTTITGYSYTMPSRVNGSYWNILANITDATPKQAFREAKFFARYEWWDRDITNPDSWEHRVRIALDNTLGPAQTNVPVRLNGTELTAAGVNLTALKAGSLRIVDPDASADANEMNGHPLAYNISSASSFAAGDNITFLANISENSVKAYYVYFSYMNAMATTSAPLSAGASFGISLDNIEDAELTINLISTDKEVYDYGDTVYVNVSLYTPNHAGTTVDVIFFNSSNAYLCDGDGGWLCLNPDDNDDNDYVWRGSVQISDDKYYRGYGTWILNVTASVGGSSETMQKEIIIEGLNATINALSYIYANDSVDVSGNVTYKASGLNASGANLTIYIEKGAYVQASYIMNADENGSYTHTFPALDVPGDFSIRVVTNHTVPQGIAKGTNTKALEIRHKADASNIAPAKSWLLEETVWINTTAKRYSSGSETIDLEINITNSSGAVVRMLSDSFIFIVSTNKTSEKEWNISGLPTAEYNVTAYLTAPSASNPYDDITKQVNQTSFTFYLLNVTAATSVPSLMTSQWVNITGFVSYPNGTPKDCLVYISLRGTNDATGLPWSKNITDASVGGQYDNYTKADVPGNFIIYATCYGTNEKGYATAPLEVNLSATVNVTSNAPSYKANTPSYLTVNVTNDAETDVNNYVVENRIVNSTGALIEYPAPKNWTIASLSSLAKNSTQTMWNTSHWAPGNYTAISEVYVSGRKIGSGNVTFEVNTTIEANAFALNINTTSLGLKADLGISGWINRTGNVVVNGTLDIYVKDYTGARVLDIAYPGEAANPGKDYVRIYNTSAYQNSPANFTNLLEYNYSALWNSWHFHNGTYTIYANFTYYDEYGALKSISFSRTVTIQPAWSASVWFGEPPNGTSYGSGQKFNASVYVQNTGNIEICDANGECKSWVQSRITDGTNPHYIDENTTYFSSVAILDDTRLVSQDTNIIPETGLSDNHPAGFNPNNDMLYAGMHAITANFTYDGGVAYNITYILVPTLDANITLSSPYSMSPFPPYPAFKDVTFNPQWQVGGNVKRYNLTEKIEMILVGSGLQASSNKTFDITPGISTLQSIGWSTAQYPNGSYLARIKLYNSSGSQASFIYSGSIVTQTDISFTITPTKNATITANTADSSYNSYENVNISGFVNNTGNVQGITGYLNLSIFGPAGYYDNLSSCDNSTFLIGNNYTCTWNTGMRENGTYTVNATYNYGSGTASASKVFTINPYTRASTGTWADKSAYNQLENANISANITNIGNAPVSGNLTINVKYGGSAVAAVNQTSGISVPVSGIHSSWGNAWNIGMSQYGSYDVVSDFAYLDENSTARTATSTRTITVNENRTVTLSMDTDKNSYKSNWGVNITVDLNNTGNAVLNGASLVYNIKSGATTIATYTDNLGDSTVSIGEAYRRSWLWNTSTYAAGTYTVEAIVADSTLASWTRAKDIDINATKTAAISGLAVDVMPPSNYDLGNTIYVYGTVNATGNVQFTGNLSLRYHNNRLVADNYDNRTDVATGFSMSPAVTASATEIDVGVINLTATFTWIDEDNIQRSVTSPISISPYVFYIGGTSVSVNTGATNTYNPDDAIPLYVHAAGMGGNLTGLAAGNFTITDGTNTYSPPMVEQGSGQYLFTFAANTFSLGDYLIRVTVNDPNTSIPGTGTENLYIRDHWITVRVNANSALASSEADAGKGYAAAKSGQALVALVQRGGTLDSLSAGASNLVMKQKLSANRFNLVMTQGSVKENIKDRIGMISSGEFEKYASPSFGFALKNEYSVSVSRAYDALDIIGVDVGTFRPGMYNLVIRNDGASNGKTKIVVSRR